VGTEATFGKPLGATGPWCVDTNHVEFAEILVLAAFRTRPYVEAHRNLRDPVDQVLQGNPDMRNADRTISMSFQHGEKDVPLGSSRLLFWIQFELPPERPGYTKRTCNYAFLRQDLSKPTVTLHLNKRLEDWACMGRNRNDLRQNGSAQSYTCALTQREFESGLAAVNVDFGIIMQLDRSRSWRNPALKPGYWTADFGNSSLELREFTLAQRRR